MSVLAYVGGVALLVATLGPLVLAADRIRRRYLSNWRGPVAVVTDLVAAFALLVLVEEALGTVGLFRRAWVAAACAVVGLVVAAWARPPRVRPLAAPFPPASRVEAYVALAVSAALVAQWTVHTARAFTVGITDVDSLAYHLPIAARFVQAHSLWHVDFAAVEYPSMFHPNNSELLHATGMLMFGTDFLSPLLNLVWLGVALLAAWCIGRPFGKGPLTLVGAAVILATPIMSATQGGAALTDVQSLALLLASVALLVQPDGGPAGLVVAGAAAGLGLGTKLTLVALLAVLTIGVVVVADRGKRVRTIAYWGVPLACTGGYWFFRNLAASHRLLPDSPVQLPGAAQLPIDQRTGFSLLHYIGDGAVWRDWFLPGVRAAMSASWWAIFAVAVAGVVLALVATRVSKYMKVLSVAAIASLLAYVFTETSAGGPRGEPVYFSINLRYTFPALVIGLVLLALAPAFAPRARASVLLAFYVAVFVVTDLGGGDLPGYPGALRPWPPGYRRAAVVAALLVLLGTLWFGRGRMRAHVTLAVVAGLALVVAGTLGWVAQHRYYADRWDGELLYRWADVVHDRRIAVQGTNTTFPFYGRHLDNDVEYVGRPGVHGHSREVQSCLEWRRRITTGRYDYVVVERSSTGEGPITWTRRDPVAVEILSGRDATLFRMDGPSPPNC